MEFTFPASQININKMNNTDPSKKPEVLVKDKQSLLLIRHAPCYSYIQSSPVKVFAVTEE
jgi:hypothetical protein